MIIMPYDSEKDMQKESKQNFRLDDMVQKRRAEDDENADKRCKRDELAEPTQILQKDHDNNQSKKAENVKHLNNFRIRLSQEPPLNTEILLAVLKNSNRDISDPEARQIFGVLRKLNPLQEGISETYESMIAQKLVNDKLEEMSDKELDEIFTKPPGVIQQVFLDWLPPEKLDHWFERCERENTVGIVNKWLETRWFSRGQQLYYNDSKLMEHYFFVKGTKDSFKCQRFVAILNEAAENEKVYPYICEAVFGTLSREAFLKVVRYKNAPIDRALLGQQILAFRELESEVMSVDNAYESLERQYEQFNELAKEDWQKNVLEWFEQLYEALEEKMGSSDCATFDQAFEVLRHQLEAEKVEKESSDDADFKRLFKLCEKQEFAVRLHEMCLIWQDLKNKSVDIENIWGNLQMIKDASVDNSETYLASKGYNDMTCWKQLIMGTYDAMWAFLQYVGTDGLLAFLQHVRATGYNLPIEKRELVEMELFLRRLEKGIVSEKLWDGISDNLRAWLDLSDDRSDITDDEATSEITDDEATLEKIIEDILAATESEKTSEDILEGRAEVDDSYEEATFSKKNRDNRRYWGIKFILKTILNKEIELPSAEMNVIKREILAITNITLKRKFLLEIWKLRFGIESRAWRFALNNDLEDKYEDLYLESSDE